MARLLKGITLLLICACVQLFTVAPASAQLDGEEFGSNIPLYRLWVNNNPEFAPGPNVDLEQPTMHRAGNIPCCVNPCTGDVCVHAGYEA